MKQPKLCQKTILLIIVIAVSALSTGCSSLNWPITPVEDVVELREQRKSETAKEFEERRDWAEFHASLTAWKQGDTMRCRQSLQRLLARNPDHAEAQELLASIDEEAKETANPLESATPVQLASYDSTSQTASPNESPAQATNNCPGFGSVKLSEHAKTAGDVTLAESAQLLAEGENALIQGDCEAAMEFFAQASSSNPDNPQIPTLAAVSALQLNRPDVAILLAIQATAHFPRSAALHRTLGVAYYRCGDYESSQVALQQALLLDNTNALTYFLQGCTLSKLGKSEAANAHLHQAATLDPRYAERRICD